MSSDFINTATAVIVEALQAGNKIFACGNGGSATQASHFVGELVGRFAFDRPALAAISLNTDTAVLTALANDYGYERTFSRQLVALGKPGDVLVALSTSGNSENVVRAAEQARLEGIVVLAFTGSDGGRLANWAEERFWHASPSSVTPYIQEHHMRILHAIAEKVEDQMFGDRAAISPVTQEEPVE